MANRLLKIGDVFIIENGQRLYVKDHGMSHEEVVAGQATEHQEYKQDEVTVDGRKYFSEKYLVAVPHKIPLVGKYVVLDTEYGGGGTGCGMNGHDDYPDGHMVTAKPVKDRGPRVSFYQTGCFTAMLTHPKLVKKGGK
jgi:hypothetical protein